jgi:DNA repair exonuclease SbcCD ATPase subunit
VIRRVSIANWRAYEQLELELSKPVTFIVAPNGVGKTSLFEAVRWAIFGLRLPRRPGARVVRLGKDVATVQVVIEFSDRRTVTVTRSITDKGRTTFEASRHPGGNQLTEEEYLDILGQEWAADPQLLAQLVFGNASPTAESAFPIRDHLAEVMGVTPMLAATEAIDRRLKNLSDDIDALRSDQQPSARTLEAAQEDVRRTEALVEEARERAESARTVVEALTQHEHAANAWREFRLIDQEFKQKSIELVARLGQVVDDDPREFVARIEAEAAGIVESSRVSQTEERIAEAESASALRLLNGKPDMCPICLRPLSEDELSYAKHRHEHGRSEAAATISSLSQELALAEERLEEVRDVRAQMAALRVPAEPSDPEPSSDELERLASAREDASSASEELGAAHARALDAREKLDALSVAMEYNTSLVAAYREEAVLNVARDAFTTASNRYLKGRIEPLVAEFSLRWKLLFGSEGLRLDPAGTLHLAMEGGELALADLSGGERVVALFLARLVIVSSATRANILRLDEPLEHLDPQRRAIVARTVVKAAQEQALKQVLVTTYEERLAHQLKATAPDTVDVAHVRSRPLGG